MPRAAVRAIRNGWRRLRFRAWTMRLRFELRRCGGRLEVDAPHGAILGSSPTVVTLPKGEGDGVLTLRLGRNVHLGRETLLEVWARGDNLLEIGDRTVISRGARLELRSGSMRIGANCQVRDHVVLKADGALELGDDVIISYGCTVHCAGNIEIADLVGVAEGATIVDCDHEVDGDDEYFMARPLRITPVVIGRNTMISAGVVVLRGASIGRNAIVAANAVVTAGQYPSGHLIAGTPAKSAKKLPGG